MILNRKTFFDKQTGKIKADIQYSCIYCKAPEELTTVKSVTKGSTSNLQKHLGQKHDIYKDVRTNIEALAPTNTASLTPKLKRLPQ